ncbi:MAG: hypothetical protein AMXMBFR58_17950 [Phycisphaerae bacterium]|nr:hypothetical protein [Phycisphaerales bacterium]
MHEPSKDSLPPAARPSPPAASTEARPSLVRRIIPVDRGEWRAVILSALYFFFILLSYYLLRPVREVMAIKRGYDDLPWLMTGTLVAMAGANPLFSWLVARYPRRIFIPATYRFFAFNMLVFLGLFYARKVVTLPENWEVWLGYAFYIWLSVFNLFVVSVFWGFSADIYRREQAIRLFGLIAIGGTIGAISGATITGWFVKSLEVPIPVMLAIAILPLELAVQCVKALLRWQAREGAAAGPGGAVAPREPGPGMWKGLELLGRSSYLMLIALYMLLFTISSTFLYMEQARIVAETFASDADRAAAFARIDTWTNVLTLTTQFFLTGQAMRLLGVGGTLCMLPVVTIAGFAALWYNPTFAVLQWFQVFRRGLHYAVDRPARETLYTVLGSDEKYKSKSFIDTFVYRAGDMIGGWTPKWVAPLGIAVPWLAIPVGAMWLTVAVVLGIKQRQKARLAKGQAAAIT